ncbi:hypothetical protein D9M68_892720 [compost metagenome]
MWFACAVPARAGRASSVTSPCCSKCGVPTSSYTLSITGGEGASVLTVTRYGAVSAVSLPAASFS